MGDPETEERGNLKSREFTNTKEIHELQGISSKITGAHTASRRTDGEVNLPLSLMELCDLSGLTPILALVDVAP